MWHNRGNVWDKMAACWAGQTDWMIARKEQNSLEDKYMFIITYTLNKMKLHPENIDKGKRFKKKTPTDLCPEYITVHTRGDGSTVQLCGDSSVACKWIEGEFAQETKYNETIGKIQWILHSWWKSPSQSQTSTIWWSTSTENATKKQITGPIKAHRDGERLMSTEKR